MSEKDYRLSKTLSYILRHGAVKQGLKVSPEGYVSINDLLAHKGIRGNYKKEDIERVVAADKKKRFILRTNPDTQSYEIKACQGHSFPLTAPELTPLFTEAIYDKVVHGTYLTCWSKIKTDGISRMNRQHIHLAKGTLDDKVLSGLRCDIQVYIFIDLRKALADGVKFFESENGVILTEGEDGYLKPKYFAKVVEVKSGALLSP